MAEVVAAEVAEAEFARLCAALRVDTDVSKMDADELEQFTNIKRRIERGIREGKVTVDENGQPTLVPSTSGIKPLTFREATGATYMAMDEADGKPFLRVVLAATELTKCPKGEVSKLRASDFNLCSALVKLFLAAE